MFLKSFKAAYVDKLVLAFRGYFRGHKGQFEWAFVVDVTMFHSHLVIH